MQYVDEDKDVISICSDEELREAFKASIFAPFVVSLQIVFKKNILECHALVESNDNVGRYLRIRLLGQSITGI